MAEIDQTQTAQMVAQLTASPPRRAPKPAPVQMDFRYNGWFSKQANVGYETLIYDVMIGDQTLFMRADTVEQTWRIVQPALEAWADGRAAEMPVYPSGGAGPAEAAALLARDGRSWRPIDDAVPGKYP